MIVINRLQRRTNDYLGLGDWWDLGILALVLWTASFGWYVWNYLCIKAGRLIWRKWSYRRAMTESGAQMLEGETPTLVPTTSGRLIEFSTESKVGHE